MNDEPSRTQAPATLPTATSAAPPRVVRRPAEAYLFLQRSVPMGGLTALADLIPVLFDGAGRHGLEVAGAPLYRFRVVDMARELVVDVGLPVAVDPPDADLPLAASDPDRPWLGTLPAGRYVTVVRVGHPDTLVQATADLLEWATAAGLRFDVHEGPDGDVWGGRIERYLTDPRDEPDMARWETELTFRLADG